MRRLVWLGIIFALIWSGWWFFAAQTISGGISQWFEDRRAEGWQAETTDISVAGFPMSLNTTLDAPALADPQTGLAFSASQLRLHAPVWQLGHVTVLFPSDDILLASPVSRRVINAQEARADIRLRPNSALEMQQSSVSSSSWQVSAPEGVIIAADGLALDALQDDATNTLYRFKLDAPAFRLGRVPREALRVPAEWPLTFERLTMEMSANFDRPFDLSSIEIARPQPTRIDLSNLEAIWGELSFRAAATLDIADQGLLTGELSLQARNWREILDLAEGAEILPAAIRPQVEAVFDALARGGGNPETIDLDISLRDGQMFIGFIPLGPAPRLVLR